MLIMEQSNWEFTRKPLRSTREIVHLRCAITRLAKYLHSRGPIAVALCPQLLKSGTSAGANYEEADDGSSPSDTLAKRRIVLRELKETNFRLRILRAEQILRSAHDPVIRESAELVKIVATIVRNSRK
jgi:four helix bundle protein